MISICTCAFDENTLRTLNTSTYRQAALLLANVPLVSALCPCDMGVRDDRTRACMRCRCVLFCTTIFVVRVLLQMSIFWSRGIPWKEVVFEAAGVIPLSFASMAKGAFSGPDSMGTSLQIAGLVLFLFGTWLNVYPEWQRHCWKRTGNAGRLYTAGLFTLARHINYTGEIISFVGLSLTTGALWTLWVPGLMAVGMCTLSVREIEFYLSQKYREDWPTYTRDVPWLMIPWLY